MQTRANASCAHSSDGARQRFHRDRDSACVAELPARLRAGRAMPDLLAESPTLPHTVDALDAAWRTWLRARPARG